MKSYREKLSHFWYNWGLVILAILLVFVVMPTIAWQVPEERAVNTANDLGYTEITILRRSVWEIFLRKECNNFKDIVLFHAEATNAVNERQRLVICEGLFNEGGTVRVKSR